MTTIGVACVRAEGRDFDGVAALALRGWGARCSTDVDGRRFMGIWH
jgi:hypothetical protein